MEQFRLTKRMFPLKIFDVKLRGLGSSLYILTGLLYLLRNFRSLKLQPLTACLLGV
jgi:hypothetical protein